METDLINKRSAAKPSNAKRSGEQTTVVELLGRAVKANASGTFFNLAGRRIAYGDFDRSTNRLARRLANAGLSKGDTIVSIMSTHEDSLALWFAALKLGAIWVPINLAYKQSFLAHQISDSGAKIVICDAEFLERVTEISAGLKDVGVIFCRGSWMTGACTIEVKNFDDLLVGDDSPLPLVVQPSDLAGLIYTSGTTGVSKGCMLSHNYMATAGKQQQRALQQTPERTTWTCLPLFHISAQCAILGALVEGLSIAIWPRFSVSSFWDDFEQSGASIVYLMGPAFSLIARAPDTPAMHRCFGKVKMTLGVPLSPEIGDIWKSRFGAEYLCTYNYGQTEASRIAMCRPGDNPPPLSAGRAADEFEIAIFDEEDRPLGPQEVGEIVYRPKQPHVMFEGYWNREKDTLRAWRNLWMHTGDLGWIDSEGWLYFTDRAKDYLRNRGENISSFEVEEAYKAHPSISEVAVHAVGAQNGEDDIKVTVVRSAGSSLNERELCLWSIDNLPYFAVPRYFEFREELVKNPTGRVLKYKLREEGVTEDTWDREAAGIIVRRS